MKIIKTNLYKKSQNQLLILWHATLPDFAEEIIEEGMIKSSNVLEEEKGMSYQGWNFYVPQREYGEGIYLHYNKEGALYYADLRLKRMWQEEENIEHLYNEEEFGFIGLFKIYILDQSKLKNEGMGEYIYYGMISNQKNSEAWFEGPEWIDKTNELQQYIKRIENIYKYFYK